jgi:multidrug efflux system membrane fusion protein
VNTKKIIVPVIVAVALSLPAASCKKGPGGGKGAAAGSKAAFDRSKITFPVETQPVALRSLIYTVNAVGSVDAFEKVQVTARVSGVVDRVLFSEGNLARVDQVLVEIEPERYSLAVESAQAYYEKAVASLADAEAGLKRRVTVTDQNPGLIPGEEVETWRTRVAVAKSDVAQTKAALNQAKLNLHDAYVRAPFSGILQTRTVQTGAYVETGTVLATLVRRDPLLLRFKVPERDAARLRTGMKADFRVRNSEAQFASKIVHVAESADDSTRLVAVTAEVEDTRDEALRPGTFAEIVVPVSSDRTAPVIPQTAIRASDRGFIAYVVENDAAAERILQLGMRTADGQVEVLSGLKSGERLVIRGAEALRNGAPIKETAAAAPAAPSPDRPIPGKD